jgi:GT2 family glycosyltransferase
MIAPSVPVKTTMRVTVPVTERVRLDGKFFRAGSQRFIVRGVSYGTFGPNKAGEPFPEPADVQRDFTLIRQLGANTVRVYDPPPPWLLDAAAAQGLRLFVTVPWASQSCFLDSRTRRREARTAVATTVCSFAKHPAIFAVAVANEIPPDIVRWSGPGRVAAFLDELVAAAREADPHCLCTYANFPPTEFLQPRHLDFVTFNVFLHQRPVLEEYLARLQLIAGDLPLVLGECGADALREGPENQARIVSDNLAAAADAGLAGAFLFTFTDDWVRAGVRVEDWQMGLTTAAREPRPAYTAVQARFAAPHYPATRYVPRVSIVVACYNGAETLRACLESLLHLDYPEFEILVIDDGSTDGTPDITVGFPQVRTLRHRINLGLSTARNLGIRAATGEIVAFTDADCQVDRHWLRFLVAAISRDAVAGVGGPNLLPPDDSPVAAAVMASPGGPTHVMLDDRTAEHVPGCNMAFWKWALDGVDGFDPVFHRAGDDVDLCWRILKRGWRIGFAPAGFVWHHRRATVADYLRQQAGYGEAEALLVAKHPEHFNALGNAIWRGRICSGHTGVLPWRHPVIHHGIFATGMFQTLYTPAADGILPFFSSVEYHALVAIPLVILATGIGPLWPLALLAWLVPPLLCALAATRATLPSDRRRWWSRPLVATLHYLQPLVRGSARFRTHLSVRDDAPKVPDSLEARSRVYGDGSARERAYWSSSWRERTEWIQRILQELDRHHWRCRPDAGWSRHDLAIFGSRWAWLEFVSVAEANRDRSQTFRARLRPRWTLSAHLTFWGLLGLQVLLFGAFSLPLRYAWIPLLTQIAIAFGILRQGRILQCRFGVLLDDVAREWKLTPTDTATSLSASVVASHSTATPANAAPPATP